MFFQGHFRYVGCLCGSPARQPCQYTAKNGFRQSHFPSYFVFFIRFVQLSVIILIYPSETTVFFIFLMNSLFPKNISLYLNILQDFDSHPFMIYPDYVLFFPFLFVSLQVFLQFLFTHAEFFF